MMSYPMLMFPSPDPRARHFYPERDYTQGRNRHHARVLLTPEATSRTTRLTPVDREKLLAYRDLAKVRTPC